MRVATSPRSAATDFTALALTRVAAVASPACPLVGGLARAPGRVFDAAGDLLSGSALLGNCGGDRAAGLADLTNRALNRIVEATQLGGVPLGAR
jgi:hypothetical protein